MIDRVMKSHANLALNRLCCFSLIKMASFHSLCFFTSVLQSWNWSVCAHSAGEISISTLVYRYDVKLFGSMVSVMHSSTKSAKTFCKLLIYTYFFYTNTYININVQTMHDCT